MTPIQICDIGPIKHLVLPLPDEGGVVVLKGRNGCGKTEALEAVRCLVCGSGHLAVRDGAAGGEVSGGDALIKVGRSTRRSGELRVLHLEGRLDIGDLVEPGLKDPETADGKRIRALIALTGVKADLALFAQIIPGGLGALKDALSAKALQETDLVEMARLVKAALESQARRLEDSAQKEDGAAAACRQAAGEVKLGTETDAEKLQAALEKALGRLNRLHQASDTAREAALRRVETERDLNAVKAEGLPDLAALIGRLDRAREDAAAKKKDLDSTASRFRAAQHDQELAAVELTTAEESLEAGERALKTAAKLEALVANLVDIVGPTENDLFKAQEAVIEARCGLEAGALARRAIEQGVAAEGHSQRSAAARAKSAGLRGAAQATDHVLSQAVACDEIQVEGGRLVTQTTRGTTFFADLSDGERWRIALDLAAERVGKGGIVVAPQRAWEGLDPGNRELVALHAKALSVTVLTAEATEGDLRAEAVL